MDEHILIVNQLQRQTEHDLQFGLDDQDFVVAFETHEPKDFLDLVMESRESRASQYGTRGSDNCLCQERVLDQLL